MAREPHDRDGKPVVTLFPATTGFKTWVTSRGDDIAQGAAGRGLGTKIALDFTQAETKTVDFEFLEPLEVHDGSFYWDPADWGFDDEFSFGVHLPASVATSTPGTGNVNEFALGGGAVMYTPAAGDGSHTIDLAADAVPITADAGDGFWDADYSTGVVTANATQTGGFNLLNFPLESFMICNIAMGHPMGMFDLDVYKVDWIHPSWKPRLTVKRVSTGSGKCGGWLMGYRKNITRT